MALQIKRTVNSGPPTGLKEGQLAVEMDPGALWVGVPTSVDPSGRKRLNPPATPPTLAGDVTGAVGTTTVARLQGRPMNNTAPTNGQQLTWNGTAWAPATLPESAGVFPPIYQIGGGNPMTATIPGWTLASRGIFYLRGAFTSLWYAGVVPRLNINNLGARDVIISHPNPMRNIGASRFGWFYGINFAGRIPRAASGGPNDDFLALWYDGSVFRQVDNSSLYEHLSQVMTGVSKMNPRHDRDIQPGYNTIACWPNP